MFFKRPKLIRRIKTDILFQNLTAIVLIVVFIIVHAYSSHSRSTIEQAKSYIQSSTNFISKKIAFSLNKAEDFVNLYVPVLENMDLKDYQNNLNLYK